MVGVHNGIIENYEELKEKLLSHGYQFYSGTDTEVLIKLVDYYYKKYKLGPMDAINRMMVRTRGSYALALMFKDYPGEIYAARLYRRVKLRTSPWRLRAGPQKAASSRSARWDCCSGVRSTSPVLPASIASRNWRYTSRVLPLPAPPRIRVSIFSPPLSADFIRFYHFTTTGGGEQAKPGEMGRFCHAGACLFGIGGAEKNTGEKPGTAGSERIEFFSIL